MKKILVLLVSVLCIFNLVARSQTVQKADSDSFMEKAKYPEKDVGKFISNKVVYPIEASKDNIEGDVVFSMIIRKDGKSDSVSLLSSDNKVLTKSALSAIGSLDKNWIPAKVNDIPIDKKYLLVFRYRQYINTEPAHYKRDAIDFFKKKKYDNALKTYDQAINDNKYDYSLFEARSQVKGILGDVEGSKQDYDASTKLLSEIMSVVNVIGYTTTTTRIVGSSLIRISR